MNKLLLFSLVLSSFSSFSQNIKRCGTYEAMQHQETITPGYLQQVNEVFNRAKEHQSQDRATVYTIPVVVHVVYNTAAENLPDSVIFNQIQVLNDSYGYTNADTVNLRDTFKTIVGTTNIQFELATVGPDGNATTGITRTQTNITEFGDFGIITGDMSGLERIKSSADGGEDPWDQTRYLNIWVADMSVSGITALMGYATPPDGLSNWPAGSTGGMSDGVVIQYQAFGSNNPNVLDPGTGAIDFRGRTCVHEVGHYLGLRHIWGDGDCTQEDGVDDTPNADANSQNITNCDTLNNTCTDNIGVLGDLPNMQENYMDYSPEACQVAFTLGQRDLMRGVIENNRWDLINNYPVASVDEVHDFDVTIYPNPSKQEVMISGFNEPVTVTIYDTKGALVKSISVVDANLTLTDLTTGIYMVNITTTTKMLTKKLIIL